MDEYAAALLLYCITVLSFALCSPKGYMRLHAFLLVLSRVYPYSNMFFPNEFSDALGQT